MFHHKYFTMTVSELKSFLDRYDDNLPVVVYAPEENTLVDAFVKNVYANDIGPYKRDHNQKCYEMNGSGGSDEVVLLSPQR